MTDLQRQLAGSAHRIYMDATYKNAPTGFKQLFTINSFIANSSGDMIQVPLCFVFMTRRRKVDYVEVLTAFRKLLLGVAVQSVLTDFEIALWSAVREVFPEATHFGCLFHWTQAIMNKVKDLGLANAYRNHSNTRQAIQQLLCLPYLPHSKIPGVFYYLMENAPKETHPLFAYVKSTWIENKRTPWGPETWSVFNKVSSKDKQRLRRSPQQVELEDEKSKSILLDFVVSTERSNKNRSDIYSSYLWVVKKAPKKER